MASALSPAAESPEEKRPLREIPGGYGLPFFGAIKDRYDYFYTQGTEEFFRSRIRKHGSTVFRVNMPPGPFVSPDPRVVTVLDALSFSVLFDTARVEKRNVLDGTFLPSLSYTGGYRVCAYLDPSEPAHSALKSFVLSLLSSLHQKFIPYFTSSLSGMFETLENAVSEKTEADFNTLSDDASFNFMFRLFTDRLPAETGLGSSGPGIVNRWLALQLAPLATLGLKYLPDFLDDLLLHTFKLPFFLVKSGYRKLYDAFYESAGRVLDEAERVGIQRDEACHNLVFLAGFNAFGGMKVLFPGLIKWVGTAGEGLHRRLSEEIRAVVKSEGGVTVSALEKMELAKSTVYEALRIEPPVPFQYGRAKEDILVGSHASSFLIKKGEMIFGYQPIATRDPRVFSDPEAFVADRFVGEGGSGLLRYVYWSNGRETDGPTADNKQCPAKDLVVLLSRVMLVELFLRYDTFTVEVGTVGLGSSVKIKSLTKAARRS